MLDLCHNKRNLGEYEGMMDVDTRLVADLIAALVTETAAAMFRTGEYAGDYPGKARLVAMSWGAEDLSSALGAREQRGADGEYSHTYEMARSLCLIGASAAGVAAIETVQPEFRDLDALAARARRRGARDHRRGAPARAAGLSHPGARSDHGRLRRRHRAPARGAARRRQPALDRQLAHRVRHRGPARR